MSEPDLGMMFLPHLNLLVKVHADKKGEYVVLPASKKKLYLKKCVRDKKSDKNQERMEEKK